MSVRIPGSKALGAVFAVGVVAATSAAITTTVATPAAAIPDNQAVCVNGSTSFTSASGWVDVTPGRTVVPTIPLTLKFEVTADVGVPAGAEVRLGWAYNAAPPLEGNRGPANFAGPTATWESRSTFGLISVNPGSSTLRPVVRLQAPNSSMVATMLHRCFTLEATTS